MSESISAKKKLNTIDLSLTTSEKEKDTAREKEVESNVKLLWLKDSLMWLFNMNQSTHPVWRIFKWKYGYLFTGWSFTKLMLTLNRYAQCSSEHHLHCD